MCPHFLLGLFHIIRVQQSIPQNHKPWIPTSFLALGLQMPGQPCNRWQIACMRGKIPCQFAKPAGRRRMHPATHRTPNPTGKPFATRNRREEDRIVERQDSIETCVRSRDLPSRWIHELIQKAVSSHCERGWRFNYMRKTAYLFVSQICLAKDPENV